MRLRFLGTRAYIPARTRAHARHSALEVTLAGGRLMIDCGADWLDQLYRLAPDAVLVTHAHPDHAAGLQNGAPCPVYGTAATAAAVRMWPHLDFRLVGERRRFRLLGAAIEAFPVLHSLRAPAVGYRIEADGAAFFYVPDVVAIDEAEAALTGVRLYVGDGSRLTSPRVFSRGGVPFGHTSVRAQIGWCARWKVPEAIFTHCGTEIVEGDTRSTAAAVREMGRAAGVRARIARDGLRVDLPSGSDRSSPEVGF